MHNTILSIIIPYYNNENYINKCIESLTTQSLRNYEIIIVDDGSKIPCAYILKKFIEKYDNIKIITHEKNMGLFQARITGFEHSTGDYIAFCDSDDFVSCDFYRPMLTYAIENATDIIVNTFAVHYSKDSYSEYYNLDPFRNTIEDLYDKNIFIEFMKQRGLFWGWHTVWNKIYKAALFRECLKNFKSLNAKAPKLIMCEDLAFSSCLFFKARSLHVLRYGYYFYCKHEEQSTNNDDIEKFKNNVRDMHAVFGFIKEFLTQYGAFFQFKRDYYAFYKLYIQMYCDVSVRLGIHAKRFITKFYNIKKLYTLHRNAHFLYKKTTSINPAFSFYEDIRKKIISEDNKYVSFDIFDTAILRKTFYPKDIFNLLDIEYNKICKGNGNIFSKIRVEAEQKVRQLNAACGSKEDITFQEIYDYIKQNYFLEESVVEHLQSKELQIELSFTFRRNFVYELYKLAKHCGKKIFFTSDMYLPRSIIENILHKNGYEEYDDLFISSEIGLTKSTGNTYKYILCNKKISPFQIIHIGDNWKDDIIMASANKFNSGFIPKTTQLMMNANPGTPTGNLWNKINLYDKEIINRNYIFDNFFSFRCMMATVANKIFDDPSISYHPHSDFNCSPFTIGYSALGMHLYAVADWLAQQHRKKDVKTLHFISRDGYLPMKAYEILAQKQSLSTSAYFYSSRKASIPLYYTNENDIGTLLSMINLCSATPVVISSIFSVYIKNFDLKEITNRCFAADIVPTKPFTEVEIFYSFMKKVLMPLFDEDKITAYHKNFDNYLHTEFYNGDSVFDVGYSGRLESLITRKTGFHLSSFYMYTYEDKHLASFKQSGNTLSTFYDFIPRGNTSLRESLFSAAEPSCIAYDVDVPSKPYIFDKNGKNTFFSQDYVYTCIQNAALAFVKDYTNIFKDYLADMPYKRIVVSLPYEVFLNFMEQDDLDVFDCSDFEDDLFMGSTMTIADTYHSIAVNENSFTNNNALWMERATILKNSKWFKLGRLMNIIKYDWEQ